MQEILALRLHYSNVFETNQCTRNAFIPVQDWGRVHDEAKLFFYAYSQMNFNRCFLSVLSKCVVPWPIFVGFFSPRQLAQALTQQFIRSAVNTF